MDTLGYATISSLQRSRLSSMNPRRHLTEDSLSFSGETSDEDSFSLSFKGSRTFSEAHNHDADSPEVELDDDSTYVGICLPMNISSFFIDHVRVQKFLTNFLILIFLAGRS